MTLLVVWVDEEGADSQVELWRNFFCTETLRADLAARPAQSALMLDPDDPRLAYTPEKVHEYHTLYPLDNQTEETQVGSLGFSSRVFKAVSETDGCTYTLRKLDGVRVTGDIHATRKQWAELAHPCLVRLRNILITSDFDGGQSNALTFVHDFVFGAMSLEERFMRGGPEAAMAAVSEELLWSYISQLVSALRFVHGQGRALRCLHASKVLVTSQHRVQVSGVGILDVVGDRKQAVADSQADDLRALGSILLQTVCHSLEATTPTSLAGSVEYLAAHYHPDLKDLVVYLITQPGGVGHVSIFAASARIAGRLLEQLDHVYEQVDAAHTELAKELNNGRLCRLMVKLNMILERQEPGNPAAADAWSETGDRYLLKLFRDYVFHQYEGERRPLVDFGSVVQQLNKLDVGVPEKILLLSRDGATCLVVTYAELKACFERSFAELLDQGNYTQGGMGRRYQEAWTSVP
mmetsp:Transcript_35221/g.92722  ORF Transcript_35221/g.92722 Transcript_35221/m.92722 type:complete len:464 (+) Transcript_35221:600-1991(+)